MDFKILLSALVMGASACALQAQELTARDTITDNNLVLPSSLDTDVRALQDNWYMQRYVVLDERENRRSGKPATDEVYIERLQQLPTVIDMPFNSVVKSYIELYAVKRADLVERMLGMSLYYMPMFEEALEKYQAPTELKYLPVVESALNPNAVSPVGATGLWQFMPTTATGEGLVVNSLVDERRDPIASSEAAVRYLQKLHDMFGDWTLALAAYNCGPGNVNKAMKRAGDSKSYWDIYPYLPSETRGYVPLFIAANYIMTYYPEHGISHSLARRPIVTDTVHVHNQVHFQTISEVLGVPFEEIRDLNPQYRADVIPGHIRPYSLTLPSEQAYCYVAFEDTILRREAELFDKPVIVNPNLGEVKEDSKGQYLEEIKEIRHVVKKNETLASIAKKYGTTVQKIRKTNKLSAQTARVKVGTTLKINIYKKKYIGGPTNAGKTDEKPEVKQPDTTKQATTGTKQGSSVDKPKPKPQYVYHKVRKGDNLSKISAKYGVSIDKIKKANKLKNDNIQIGQTLKIPKR